MKAFGNDATGAAGGGAGRLDLHSGTPYWLSLDGDRAEAPPLDHEVNCDVAIVGGGITGALTAVALIGEGLHIALVDRRQPGCGSTAASTALLQYDTDTTLRQLTDAVGLDNAQRAYRLGVDAIDRLKAVGDELDVPVDDVPSMHFTCDEDDVDTLTREFDGRKAMDLDVRWLRREELREQWGIDAAGAICSAGAAQVNPYALCQALLEHAREKGVEIYGGTTVTSALRHSDGLLLRTDRGPSIAARHVVYATGYEAAVHLPKTLVRLHSTYAIASQPIDRANDAPRFTMWERADPYIYARFTDGRLIIGGEDERFVDEARRDALMKRKAVDLAQKANRVLPDRDIQPQHVWTGTFGSTRDGLGYIGRMKKADRSFFALGFGGNGITCAEIAARILADTIVGRKNADAQIYRFGR